MKASLAEKWLLVLQEISEDAAVPFGIWGHIDAIRTISERDGICSVISTCCIDLSQLSSRARTG